MSDQCESRAEVLTGARLPRKYCRHQTASAGGTALLTQGRLLGSVLWLGEQIPPSPPPAKRRRGRPATYADQLFVQALLVRSVRRLSTAYALLYVLEPDEPIARPLRPRLTERGRLPTRHTWERRCETLPARLPARLGCLGRPRVALLQPWAAPGHAAAGDRPPLRANGGGWHKPQRLAGEGPQTARDTAAAWRQSGSHGWWDGWKRPRAVVGGRVWLPWAAACPIASAAEHVLAPQRLEPWPLAVREVLGDTHDTTPEWRAAWA